MDYNPYLSAFSLKGKKALVTGASRGIGFEISRALGYAGALVTMLSRPSADLEQSKQKLHEEGLTVRTLGFDLSEPQKLEDILTLESAYDIVVYSAGIAKHAPFLEIMPRQYYDVMSLNLDAAFWVSQFCARQMVKEQKTGSIIMISSQMGHVGGKLRTVYCASKHGLEGLVKAMAIELGPHQIRVNTVAPTFIETELTKNALGDTQFKHDVLSKIKLGRLGQPQDVAYATCFLASDASNMITGTSLLVDGGWTAE